MGRFASATPEHESTVVTATRRRPLQRHQVSPSTCSRKESGTVNVLVAGSLQLARTAQCPHGHGSAATNKHEEAMFPEPHANSRLRQPPLPLAPHWAYDKPPAAISQGHPDNAAKLNDTRHIAAANDTRHIAAAADDTRLSKGPTTN